MYPVYCYGKADTSSCLKGIRPETSDGWLLKLPDGLEVTVTCFSLCLVAASLYNTFLVLVGLLDPGISFFSTFLLVEEPHAVRLITGRVMMIVVKVRIILPFVFRKNSQVRNAEVSVGKKSSAVTFFLN